MHHEREKLLLARAEIVELLKRHGLVAAVVMCANDGKVELMLQLEAPWCKAFIEGGNIRLRSKLADYGGDRKRQRAELESTLSALSAIGEASAHQAMAMLAVAAQFDKATGAVHTPLERDEGLQ